MTTTASETEQLPTAASNGPTTTTTTTTTTAANGQTNSNSNSKCNLTLVLHDKLRMELEQRPLPAKPRPNEVSLATHTVGICGSDVKYWQTGKIGPFVVRAPMILGHETSAVVLEVGDEVRRQGKLAPGDRVAVEVGLPCGSCNYCKSGRYNLCLQMAFAATPPHDGTLTRYFNHPADYCFRLPRSVSLEEGALLEPMAVAVHACQRAPVKLGDIVLVCGAGAVGLLAMLVAKAFGAAHVIVTDIMEARLAFARQLGASATFLASRQLSPADMAQQQVREFVRQARPAGPQGVDVVLECSGAEPSLHLAFHSAGMGGQVVCVGCQPDTVSVPLNTAVMQEIDIKGVFRYRNCYPLALSLVETGKIDLRPLITHRFRLEQAPQAFEACLRGEGVKILIGCMDDKLKLAADDDSQKPRVEMSPNEPK